MDHSCVDSDKGFFCLLSFRQGRRGERKGKSLGATPSQTTGRRQRTVTRHQCHDLSSLPTPLRLVVAAAAVTTRCCSCCHHRRRNPSSPPPVPYCCRLAAAESPYLFLLPIILFYLHLPPCCRSAPTSDPAPHDFNQALNIVQSKIWHKRDLLRKSHCRRFPCAARPH